MSHPDNKAEQSQVDKFRDLARELKADEDEARFEETVRKIAPKGGAVTCRRCSGEGKVPKVQDCVPAAHPPEIEFETCANCKGTGLV